MNADMSQYLGVFLDEGQEQLDQIEASCLALERSPEEREHLQVLFRAAHTLKGSSRAMGFVGIGDLTHEMENVLDDLRNEKLTISKLVIDVILKCLDVLHQMIDEVSTSSAEPDPESIGVPDLIATLTACRSGQETPNVEPVAEFSGFESGNAGLEIGISPSCFMKGIRAVIVLNALREICEIESVQPSEADLENEAFENSFIVWIKGGPISEESREAIAGLSDVDSVVFLEAQTSLTPQEPLTNSTQTLDGLPTPEAEVLASPKMKTPAVADRPKSTAPAANQTIRVDVARLDKLLNLVGELITDRTQVETCSKQILKRFANDPDVLALEEAVNRITRISSELQDEVMKTRMLPIDGVFQRMPRMIRDLADRLGKSVEFTMAGGATEIDRSIIDAIGDPIIHLLRNAIDHGVELPADRVSSGKNEVAQVHLSASRQQGSIHISITDDGAGINPDKLRSAAVGKGLLSQAAANNLTDLEAIHLIFAPGFSTAKAVSDVSGRGVGMDIVRENIEKVGGSVTLVSTPGLGSTFLIKLPLSLAIVRVILVGDAGVTYALPVSSVREMVDISAKNDTLRRGTVGGKPVLVHKGTPIPMFNLSDLLHSGVAPRGKKSKRRKPENAVLIYSGDRVVAVTVEHLYEEQEVVVKPLGSLLKGVSKIAGASILGNGGVVLIVDPVRIVDKPLLQSAA